MIRSIYNILIKKKGSLFFSKSFLAHKVCEKNNYSTLSSNTFKNLDTFKSLQGYKFLRFYVALSHSLLHFEVIRVPHNLSKSQKFSFAKLEALRIYHLINSAKNDLSFSFYELSDNEVLVSITTKNILNEIKNSFNKTCLISGIFPAWVPLFSFVKLKEDMPLNGLYYISHQDGYEGFWLKDGKLGGIIPSSCSAAKELIRYYKGFVKELSLSSLFEGSCHISPSLFSGDVPCFEDFSFLFPPKISLKVLPLWFLPLAIYLFAQYVGFLNSELSVDLLRLEKKLHLLERDLAKIEKIKEEIELRKKMFEIVSSYLPDKRISLLSSLLEMTLSLPDGVWVRRFEYRFPNEIRIWGEADNALEVLEILSQSDLFYDVKLLTTVRKNIAKNKEVFAISLKIKI